LAGFFRSTVFAALIAALVSYLALPTSASAQSRPGLRIVATTSMIADAIRQIGGDRVEVTALMGPGVDPHSYRQTRSDIAAMTGADAVFFHGLYLEAQLEEFFATLAKHKTVVAVADHLPRDQLIGHDTYQGRYDPHVWMDPRRWKLVVETIREELAKLAPDSRAQFETNATRHLAEIDQLAAYADRALASVPRGARILITAHDAFNYFGRAYDFEVLGIQGISTESEAGLKRVEELVSLLVDRRIRAIFVESSVSDRNVRALVEGAAARQGKVQIGGELFSDAMGAPGSSEGTYIGMIDHNVTVISRALGGNAPEKGMNGRLATM
jgi:manganese/zinc/iron transport system substrate-binding protein